MVKVMKSKVEEDLNSTVNDTESSETEGLMVEKERKHANEKAQTPSGIQAEMGSASQSYVKTDTMNHKGSEYRHDKEFRLYPPLSLIPDSKNPRPNWKIDDEWLENYLLLSKEESKLVKIDYSDEHPNGVLKHIPSWDELLKFHGSQAGLEESQRENWEYLKELATNIFNEGQRQPVEVFEKNGVIVVCEGHIRRLATILVDISYLEATHNNKIKDISDDKILELQLAANNKRLKNSFEEKWIISKRYYNSLEDGARTKLTKRKLASLLTIKDETAGFILKALQALPNGIKGCPKEVLDCLDKQFLTQAKFSEVMKAKQDAKKVKLCAPLLGINQEQDETKSKGKGSGRPKSALRFVIASKQNSIDVGRFLVDRIPELKDKFNKSEINEVSDTHKILEELSKLVEEASNG